LLQADICQLGMDQRKVNMLAREYCDAASPKIKFKPVILSHHMLMGLKEGEWWGVGRGLGLGLNASG
jgi:tyrosyl-tRNA synthetase